MAEERAMTQAALNKRKRRSTRNMKGKAMESRQNSSTAENAKQATGIAGADGCLPPNGHPVDANKNKFIKQESEASSSGATADINNLNDSVITNTSSVANKSSATTISLGGQTNRSTGAESISSSQSNQSSSEIKAKGVKFLQKFYAKQNGDKRKCLLRDVAITDSGQILITDSRNKNIKVFSIDEGKYIRSIDHPELKDPFGVAAMPDSRFVVADCKSKDLKIFSLEGSLLNTVGRNLDDYPMKEPRGVAVNSKGEIIVSDAARRCVYIYPLEGAFCDIIWGEAGLKPLQFKNPAYVGVTEHDDILVSDYFSKKIALFDAQTHDLKFTYGTKKNDRRLKYPRGVSVDPEGNILIADNYNGKVHYVNGEEGEFIRYVYGDKHGIHRPRSVATDHAGHMVIIENGGRVKIFDISSMSPDLEPADIKPPTLEEELEEVIEHEEPRPNGVEVLS